ncbi:dihydrofolate reductase [Clostridium culturomicium]|uniref:dihydrofolate reductase n=1 Tax=Clostridium culturomicium TaxID=1499683 RepID=UPI00058FC28B|nr:dihydrofolate reductase [Clostridium culturomicium]
MVSLIVAYGNNKVIGNLGKMPWDIKGELKRFKELTTGNVVIMGRRTYESIGRPLPDRMNIVISNTKEYNEVNVKTAKSLEEAIRMAGDKEIYISGGSRVYEEALSMVEKMYITEVDITIDGDTYFPEFDESRFIKEINEKVDGEIPYVYVTYTRK